jgi:hypothetical protein
MPSPQEGHPKPFAIVVGHDRGKYEADEKERVSVGFAEAVRVGKRWSIRTSYFSGMDRNVLTRYLADSAIQPSTDPAALNARQHDGPTHQSWVLTVVPAQFHSNPSFLESGQV